MSCQYYKWNGDYWCQKDNKRVSDANYYKYCRNYGYSDCPTYKTSDSSGCYLTTMVCNILGKKDDDIVLNKLRQFRNNILQKDKKYISILKDYDTIGPIISDYIANDYFNNFLSDKIYNRILIPIVHQLDNQEYNRAVSMYQNMMISLINHYKLNDVYLNVHNNNQTLEYTDLNFSGHGINKYLAKKLSL